MLKTTEFVIDYINGKEDYFDTQYDAENVFNKIDKKKVRQFYRKDWINTTGEWMEDYVEVYYTNLK